MKYGRIMLITFLVLAILMIGAVSASDENATDTLTIDDEISVGESDDEPPITSDIGNEDDNSSNEILSAKSDPALVVTADDVIYGNDAIINVNTNSDATGLIKLSVAGSSYSSEIVWGQCMFDIPGLSLGTYNVTANYTGDENYNSATASILFSVIAGNNFATLQLLIDGASDSLTLSNDYSGEGSEINIDKAITIDGQGHTLNANRLSRIFNIDADGVILKNLNLINASSSGYGGAILSQKALNLINCSIVNCSSDYGGAVSIGWTYDSLINDTTFTNNTAKEGGAVYSLGNLTISNSTFENNSAITMTGHGGAISSHSTLNILNSYFIKNNALASAGAIYLEDDALITNCAFINNTASRSASSIEIPQGISVVISNSLFSDVPNEWVFTIFNNGNLSLSNNTIVGQVVNSGKIVSDIIVVIMDNTTHKCNKGEIIIAVKLTDDNDNVILMDSCPSVTVGDRILTTSLADDHFEASISDMPVGTYVVNLSSPESNMIVFTSTISVYRSFMDLSNLIGNTSDETILLDENYTFIPELDGSLSEGIAIDKAITIDGQGCTLDANGSSRIFNIAAGGVVLKNLNLINANFSGYGGGINCNGSISLINCSFMNCSSDYGGAINIAGNNAAIMDCSFVNCSSMNYGGAIYIQGMDAVISHSNFENSHAYNGGIIYMAGDNAVVKQSLLNNGHATNNGGAIYATGSNCTVSNSNFTNNLAELSGGGIYWYGGSSSRYNTVDGCIFTNNTAHGNTTGSITRGGGAIYWSENGQMGTVKNSEFYYNSVQSTIDQKVNGGAILWDKNRHALVDNCIFVGNFVTTNGDTSGTSASDVWAQGGAMYLRPNSNYTVRNCLFENCSSSKEAGALYIQSTSGSDRKVLVENSTFRNNVAQANGNYNINGGGAIQVKQATNIEFIDLTFTNNTANKGGALAISDSVNGYQLINSTFDGNKAIDGSGGSIFSSSALTLINVTIYNSSASVHGGAIYCMARGNFDNISIFNSHAGVNGGGVYSQDDSVLISKSLFADNNATSGSAIYNAAFEDCIFERNTQPDIYPVRNKTSPEFFTCVFNQTLYEYGQSVGIEAYLPSNTTGVVYFAVSDESNVIIHNIRVILNDSKASCTFPDLAIGKYNLTLKYSGDADHFDAELTNRSFEILKKRTHPQITVVFNQSLYQYGQSVEVSALLPSNASGVVCLVLSTKNNGIINNVTASIIEGKATYSFSNLSVEVYYLAIEYDGDRNYYHSQSNSTFNILPIVNITDKVIAGDNGQISMKFGDVSDDFVDIFIDSKRYGSQIIDDGEMIYPFSTNKLAAGNHTITFGYDGLLIDENLFSYWDEGSGKYKPIEFNLEILPKEVIIDPEPDEQLEFCEAYVYDTEGHIAIDAKGTIEFFVNGVSVAVVEVVNGIARLDISKYKNGKYIISWKYSGDDKYNESEGKSVITINRIPVRIVASDLSIIYTSAKVYSVKVYGVTGKVAKGTNVVFLINNKAYKTVKTNANGVANVAITKTPGLYKITAKALGASITKKLTVNHALTLKTVKVKRSAKKLVIKATLKKIDSKFLKGKKITLKFNGKKFTAKTSKKGVAKFTIKSSILKKLKAGKKVKYQATYKKDTVKKSVKVKK